MFGSKGRIGLIVPGNNGVIEPELWPRLPPGVAAYATRVLARGDLTPDAVVAMETQVDRAVDELTATIVDVIAFADMVTTFIMDPHWNDRRSAGITARTGVACITCWTALRDALEVLNVRRFALGTPYPRKIHDSTAPYFERLGYRVTANGTLDILAMADVPRVRSEDLRGLVRGLDVAEAEAIVLLATDLPTFADIQSLEDEAGLPVLSSNQVLLWRALRACGNTTPVPDLGRLLREH